MKLLVSMVISFILVYCRLLFTISKYLMDTNENHPREAIIEYTYSFTSMFVSDRVWTWRQLNLLDKIVGFFYSVMVK